MRTVLLIDDEPAITSTLNRYFTGAGYATILDHSDQEALEKLAANP